MEYHYRWQEMVVYVKPVEICWTASFVALTVNQLVTLMQKKSVNNSLKERTQEEADTADLVCSSSGRSSRQYTCNSIDFLDLTIYKGPRHTKSLILDIEPFKKTTQQYLEYSSAHHKGIFASLVKGVLMH